MVNVTKIVAKDEVKKVSITVRTQEKAGRRSRADLRLSHDCRVDGIVESLAKAFNYRVIKVS